MLDLLQEIEKLEAEDKDLGTELTQNTNFYKRHPMPDNCKLVPGTSCKVATTQCGKVYSLSSLGYWKLLSQSVSNYGYMQTSRGLVHRLVCAAWNGLPEDETKIEVNHKDLNKHNNHCDNLEWMSKRENMDHWLNSREFKL